MLVPVLTGLAALLVVLCAGSLVHEPVSRTRLELFARRQRLHITATNGNQVITYLATTRRWRASGLVHWHPRVHRRGRWRRMASPCTHWDYSPGGSRAPAQRRRRIAHLSLPRRRAAYVRPRRPAAYLPRPAWALLTVCAGLSVAIAITTAVLAALGRADPGAPAVFWLVAALVVAGMVRSTQLRVLRRPQPVAEPDILAADDAIRSRSLHVLTGGGVALVLYCCSGQLATINLAPNSYRAHTRSAGYVGLVVVLSPVIGFSVGIWPWGAQGVGDTSAPTAAAGST